MLDSHSTGSTLEFPCAGLADEIGVEELQHESETYRQELDVEEEPVV
jgi:hypothetical protein